MGLLKIILCLIISQPILAMDSLRSISAQEELINKDLQLILRHGNIQGLIKMEHVYKYGDYARVSCEKGKIKLKIYSLSKEWSSTLYYTLQKLGFLFPHPRFQITPDKKTMYKQCGKKISWKPALKYRGFHLHTLHPNEWVEGFLLGKTAVALDYVRWLARNQQNMFDLSLLRIDQEKIFKNLKEPFKLAKGLGIHTGITIGIAFHQQNSYKLVSIIGSLSNKLSYNEISRNLKKLLNNIDVSFINLESGTSEFTPVSYERTLKWFNQIARIAKKKSVKMLVKAHISSNQSNKKYGNYNFLPQFSAPDVGVLPHTVFYYGLNDPTAPMYGNKNFSEMRDFLIQEKSKRRTWYYPETSYFIAMDIDIPLFLLEYLRGRAEDMKFIHKNNIEGQLVFSSGQELGYWLFDWSVTLFNNLENQFDPLTGLKLLGEDPELFKKHLEFHYEYMTKKQMIPLISFSNLGDEIAPGHKVHKRTLMRDLVKDKGEVEQQVFLLASAVNNIPSTEEIKQPEIKKLLNVTYQRIRHALYVRKAILGKKDKNLKEAEKIRQTTLKLMQSFEKGFNRYPSLQLYEEHDNPTSYPWGYGYPALTLHFWEREEAMIRQESYSPFFMNIYDFLDILF